MAHIVPPSADQTASSSSSSVGGRVGLSYEAFALRLDRQGKPVTGPPASLDVKFVVVWNWPAKSGNGYIEHINGASGPPLPITMHRVSGEEFMFEVGEVSEPIELPHYKLEIKSGWLSDKAGRKAALLKTGSDGSLVYSVGLLRE